MIEVCLRLTDENNNTIEEYSKRFKSEDDLTDYVNKYNEHPFLYINVISIVKCQVFGKLAIAVD